MGVPFMQLGKMYSNWRFLARKVWWISMGSFIVYGRMERLVFGRCMRIPRRLLRWLLKGSLGRHRLKTDLVLVLVCWNKIVCRWLINWFMFKKHRNCFVEQLKVRHSAYSPPQFITPIQPINAALRIFTLCHLKASFLFLIPRSLHSQTLREQLGK